MIGKIVKFKLNDGCFAYFKVLQEFSSIIRDICHCQCMKDCSIGPYKYLVGDYNNIYKDCLIEITQEEFDKIVVFE